MLRGHILENYTNHFASSNDSAHDNNAPQEENITAQSSVTNCTLNVPKRKAWMVMAQLRIVYMIQATFILILLHRILPAKCNVAYSA
eukprot:m.95370 g.95370  ORF g.95370 m.95370 type:complete len:87 (+) comp16591_c0_seq2:380-640(+)